jgi:hypothetical protein
MLRTLPLLLCLAAAPAAFAADAYGPTYATPEEAAKDPDFAVQGEYAADGVGVQVVAQGNGLFRVVTYKGGLPGDGWDSSSPMVAEQDAAATQQTLEAGSLKKVERTSETLGAQPPEGAVVLFDGTDLSIKRHWGTMGSIDEHGLLIQGAQSKDLFTDFTVHIEFRLPYMPEAREQKRGNSGYYMQGRYEIQMLDSFGLEGLDNECGGIYKVARPDVNMCYPPLAWQTYDIDFTAAKFDDAGNKTAPAHAVVKHNGVLIHDRDLVMTPGGPKEFASETNTPGPVYLQDHGNPVRYRNIWVVTK